MLHVININGNKNDTISWHESVEADHVSNVFTHAYESLLRKISICNFVISKCSDFIWMTNGFQWGHSLWIPVEKNIALLPSLRIETVYNTKFR